MSNNPYTAQHASAASALAAANESLQAEYELIQWYQAFDPGNAKAKLDEALDEIKTRSWNISALLGVLAVKRSPIEYVARVVGITTDRAKREREAYEKIQAQEAENRARLAILEPMAHRLENDLRLYRSTNVVDIDEGISALAAQVKELKPIGVNLRAKRDAFDAEIAPLLADVEQAKADLKTALSNAQQAEAFLARAKLARDTADTARVNQQCCATFGIPPQKAVELTQSTVERLNRTLKKCHERVELLLARDSRVISRLVFDGTNLCYRHERKTKSFIGLTALQALVQVLPGLGVLAPNAEIIVVFDPGIARRLSAKWSEVVSRFPPSVEVYEVPKGQKADTIVLNLAAEAGAYVVSNDNFVEFSAWPAVRERRVFKHNILVNSIFVDALPAGVTFEMSAVNKTSAKTD